MEPYSSYTGNYRPHDCVLSTLHNVDANVVIVDECHYARAREWSAKCKELACKATFVLGLTATLIPPSNEDLLAWMSRYVSVVGIGRITPRKDFDWLPYLAPIEITTVSSRVILGV